MRYRPEIDGLRALAIVSVVINHLNAGWLPGGFLGVDIFFAISGYVITGSILRGAEQESHPDLGSFLVDFYRRRIQRLVPALAVFVAITSFLICLVEMEPKETLSTGITALFGVSNIHLYRQSVDYFGGEALFNAFTHTWSLGVEEQFYLFFPVIAWLSLGLGRAAPPRDRRFRWVLGVGGLLSLIWFAWLSDTDPDAAYYLTPGRLWELAAGALLFMVLHRPGPGRFDRIANRLLTHIPTWASLGLLVGVQFLPKEESTRATIIAIAASCTLMAGLLRESRLKALLLTPWLRHIGLLSYSLYLWHWSVLTLSRWTIGIHAWSIPLQLGLMLLLAELSWRHVETPLRAHRWTVRSWQTLPLGVGVNGMVAGTLALLLMQGGAEHLYTGRRPAPDARHVIPGTSIERGRCLVKKLKVIDEADFEAHARSCSSDGMQQSDPGQQRLFLLGDSHATSLLPMARRLHDRGFAITHLAREGCPFPATAADHSLRGCAAFQRNAEALTLKRGRPGDVVIIAGYHLSHLGGPETEDHRNGFLDERGRRITDPARKLTLYADALDRFGAEARRGGMEVAVVGAGPRLIDRDVCLPEWFRPERLLGDCRRQLTIDIALAENMNDRLRARLGEITFLDAVHLLCPEGCSLETMRQWLQDDDHLSEAGAIRLERAVLPLLKPASP